MPSAVSQMRAALAQRMAAAYGPGTRDYSSISQSPQQQFQPQAAPVAPQAAAGSSGSGFSVGEGFPLQNLFASLLSKYLSKPPQHMPPPQPMFQYLEDDSPQWSPQVNDYFEHQSYTRRVGPDGEMQRIYDRTIDPRFYSGQQLLKTGPRDLAV